MNPDLKADPTSAAPSDSDAALVFDVTTAQFQKQVLDRSQSQPVVIDFWAEWCGPCRMLGPVLEKAVLERGGKVALAKINTDHEPALAQRFRIQGIPAVKAFYKGRLINEFVGARDARFIATFLDSVIPSPAEEQLADATTLFTQGKVREAADLLRPLSRDDGGLQPPLRNRVRVLLAETLLALDTRGGNDAEATALLDQLDPRSPEVERAELLRDYLAFVAESSKATGDEAERVQKDEKDFDARYVLAAVKARAAAHEQAFELLLEIVARSRHYRDGAAVKAIITLCKFLGPENDLSHEYRRRLQVYV